MPRSIVIAFAILCYFVRLAPAQAYQELSVAFYAENIQISYEPEMLRLPKPTIDDKGLTRHFSALSNSGYAAVLRSLQQARKALQLNDWLYYQLMKKTLSELYAQQAEAELAAWFLLSQSGFDTRLAYLGEDVFVFVYTQDAIFEAPIIKDQGRSFVNLTDIRGGGNPQRALYLLEFKPNANGQAFSFKLDKLPLLRPKPQEKQLRFTLHGKIYVLNIQTDTQVKQYMAGYPLMDEGAYLDVPLSTTLAESLLPQLRKMLEGKNEWESVELLTAFTRSAFAYQEDKSYFGYNKPMVAEEVLLYPFSDCEDRCALFIRLVDKLLGLPMIVLAYPGHLSVAVALPQIKEGFVRYQGKAYYICDPTGPAESSVIGRAPEGYEQDSFEIIKHYK